jgi:hypothetical protein
MQQRGKQTIFCLLMAALLLPTFSLRAETLPPAPDDDVIINRVFRDNQGIPCLRTKNGRLGRYLKMSGDEVEIEIHAAQLIGTVRMQRSGFATDRAGMGKISIALTSPSGNQLTFGATSTKDGQLESVVKFNDSTISVDPLAYRDQPGGRPATHRGVEALLARAAGDASLQRLTAEALPFLTKSALLKVLPAALSEHQYVSDCAVEATDCLVSLVAYGVSMSALYSSCGFTLGAGCIAALLAHPVMGGAVVIYCGRALQSCGITR